MSGNAAHRAAPVDLPGGSYTTIINEPLDKFDLDKRLDAFAKLATMYAKNQIFLQYAQLLPRDQRYLKIGKYEVKGQRTGTRMDELLAVSYTDNSLREVADMKN